VLLSSFDYYILDRLPPYWDDFHPVLQGLHAALWPKECSVLNQPNVATHDAFLEVLTKAIRQYQAAEEVAYPFAPVPPKSNLEKRTRKSGNNVDEAEAERANKVARGEGNQRIARLPQGLPHNLAKQSFSSYVDSGAPIVTQQ
jgi:hypothetical protein